MGLICRWLGVNVIALSGVRIGRGSVVGAGSVVTRLFCPWCLPPESSQSGNDACLDKRSAGASVVMSYQKSEICLLTETGGFFGQGLMP
ncbi:MAG: hypothetical protein ABIR29_03790, partial [Chthoniobacterales bacterium]